MEMPISPFSSEEVLAGAEPPQAVRARRVAAERDEINASRVVRLVTMVLL
jgi:hypothetical protein